VSGGKKSVSITSVRKQNPQSLVSSDPSEMMYKVGLNENRKFVEITRISNKPFGAPTLEQPKPNTTTTQQTVNNNSNGEATAEIKQASSSTTAGLTEQLPEVNSTQELSTPNNEPVKDDDKEADNPQPEISANGSAPTDSSSFDIVSSQATTPDELQEPDEDKELARQSEADQKAPANDDGPNSLVAKPEVQTASNDLSHKSQSQ